MFRGTRIALLLCCCGATAAEAQMNPYFGGISYPVPEDTLMLAVLPDLQVARFGPDFLTAMVMAEYGVTSRWGVGLMVEGQKISGLPVTYSGLRVNTYFRVFPHDRLLNFTLYGEYEGLNEAALYKMEIAGFGAGDLSEPLSKARHIPARTFEQRAIVYHDWGRLNLTFNFVSETGLDSGENDFGYVWGLFRHAAWMGMEMGASSMQSHASGATEASEMPGMSGTAAQGGLEPGASAGMGASGSSDMSTPPALSLRRLGLGLEMMGGLGNAHQFGLHWSREQQYLGALFRYSLSRRWEVRVEPLFGLSDVSDPFVLRMGVGYTVDRLFRR